MDCGYMSQMAGDQARAFWSTVTTPAWWLLVAGASLLAGLLVFVMIAHSFLLVIVGGLLAAAGIVLATSINADRAVADSAYNGWAQRQGLAPSLNLIAPMVTPLLRGGDTRRLENGMRGTVDGRDLVVGHFTWETIYREEDQYGNVRETRVPHHATVLETITGLEPLLRMTLDPRRSGEGRIADALQSFATVDRAVQLESAEFDSAYRLFVADQESELTVRRVFSPAVIVQLLELAAAGVAVEFETGALVCFLPGRVWDPERLDALCETAAVIASALAA
jgi:hypothetical protein